MIGPEGVFFVLGSVDVFKTAQAVSRGTPAETTVIKTAHAWHFAATPLEKKNERELVSGVFVENLVEFWLKVLNASLTKCVVSTSHLHCPVMTVVLSVNDDAGSASRICGD